MNAKDFLRLGVPLGEATRRAENFVSKFILGGGDKCRLHEEVRKPASRENILHDLAMHIGQAV